jgi:UDPglucose 6-dehydrogenase
MGNRLSFFGLGKLGLPLAAMFASNGVRTVGIDTNARLVARLEAGDIPYAEPGLAELLEAARPGLTFTNDASHAADTEASIILVPTPSTPDAPDLSIAYVLKACEDLASVLRSRPQARYHLIVVSSTVGPGAIADRITPALEDFLGQRAGPDFGVAYVPDFVALGEVVGGFRHPSLLAVGSDDDGAAALTVELYRRIVAPGTPIRVLSSRDAEITKMAHNVFLAMKVSFANFLAQLGERLGSINVDAITEALALEPKIGRGYLSPGSPYGGPCWPRDTMAFLHLASSLGLEASFVQATERINRAQFDFIENCVLSARPQRLAVLGLSFKAGTPVTIASPAFELIGRLTKHALDIFAYDPAPEARELARETFGAKITCCESMAEAVAAADCILVCNPDPTFSSLAEQIAPNRKIIDPWGLIQEFHPGLIQPGRAALDARASSKDEGRERKPAAE